MAKGIQTAEITGLVPGNIYDYTIKTKDTISNISTGVVYTVRFHVYEYVRSFAINSFEAGHLLTTGLGVDSEGNVYVSNYGENEIIKYDSTGGLIKTWLFDDPNGDNEGMTLAKDPSDNLTYIFVAQCATGKIFKYDLDGELVNDNGGIFISVNWLEGFWFGMGSDNDGNIYVCHEDGDIEKIDSTGTITKTFTGSFVYCTVDTNGSVFGSGDNIIKFDEDGNVIKSISGLDVDPLGSETAKTHRGRSIAAGLDGCIAGVDNLNHKVYIYDNDLNLVKSWGTLGTEAGTQFTRPDVVAFDEQGYLYVLEIGDGENNRRVQIFRP